MNGFSNGSEFVSDLTATYNLICIKEHWLKQDELNLLFSLSGSHSAISYSAIACNVVFYDRPYGGLSIMYNKNKIKIISNFWCSINNRIMACKFELNNKSFVLFNIYMPCWRDELHSADFGIIRGFMRN